MLRDRFTKASEGEIKATAEAYKLGANLDMRLERPIWQKCLAKVYRAEDRIHIERKVVEAI